MAIHARIKNALPYLQLTVCLKAQALRDPHTTIAMELRTVVNAYKRVLGQHLLKKTSLFLVSH